MSAGRSRGGIVIGVAALLVTGVVALLVAGASGQAVQSAGPATQAASEPIPTGVSITPQAAPGSRFEPLNPDVPEDPTFTVDHAVTTAIGPDGTTLLVLTSGYNIENFTSGPNAGRPDPALSSEYVFVFDIGGAAPVKKQVLQVPNALEGLAWNPSGREFYVAGWATDRRSNFLGDKIFVFDYDAGGDRWIPAPEIALGHTAALALGRLAPAPAGIAVSPDGTRLIVANFENDSVSVVDVAGRRKVAELDLRPGNGRPGGEYPFWAVFKDNQAAFVSSARDREIVAVDLSAPTPSVADRIHLRGQPTRMVLDRNQNRLFAVEPNRDAVAIISTASHRVLEEINTTAPATVLSNRGGYKGSNPTGLALSPREDRLYVTNGGANSVAIIRLAEPAEAERPEKAAKSEVIGLIPTGWYPNAVTLNASGSALYVVNGKSNAGPVPQACHDRASIVGRGAPPTGRVPCGAANQYIWQRTKAGFLVLPTPSSRDLEALTEQVALNNHYARVDHDEAAPVMAFLRQRIKHVIYIVKENRTYDQILGDLRVGNGDPSLTVYPQPVTPNHHALARRFVDLDNFYDSAESSGDGWNWVTSAQVTDPIEQTEPINYAHRGLSYDYEGTNRNVNVGLGTIAERQQANPLTPSDPDLLPGTADISAPDGPEDEEGAGYLWDAALRSGVRLRNYGFFLDLSRYSLPASNRAAILPGLVDPFASQTPVAFATKAALQPLTDPFFRGFDNKFPDVLRVREWAREFDEFERSGELPALEFVRLMHDHTGDFGAAIDGVNTPTLQMADNDYAVGLIVDKVSHSPRYRNATLVFVVEDDSQDGPDHVDAHRSIALLAGAYVKRGAVVSKRYTTVSLVRTIVDILGIGHLNLNEVAAEPMDDAFGLRASPWTFDAVVPRPLRNTSLPLPPPPSPKGRRPPRAQAEARPDHDAAYWEEQTRGFDFSAEDRLDAARYNEILWRGIMGDRVPYPTVRSGLNLRHRRAHLLSAHTEGTPPR